MSQRKYFAWFKRELGYFLGLHNPQRSPWPIWSVEEMIRIFESKYDTFQGVNYLRQGVVTHVFCLLRGLVVPSADPPPRHILLECMTQKANPDDQQSPSRQPLEAQAAWREWLRSKQGGGDNGVEPGPKATTIQIDLSYR